MECTCGNPEFGFNCACEHMRKSPGNRQFSCEFCGFYAASKGQCSRCEEDTPEAIVSDEELRSNGYVRVRCVENNEVVIENEDGDLEVFAIRHEHNDAVGIRARFEAFCCLVEGLGHVLRLLG